MPRAYKAMVPPYLPAPEVLVYASGAVQIAGGAGLMTDSTRRAAGWWLIATLIAMFPANVHMAINPDQYPGFPGGARALWRAYRFRPSSSAGYVHRCKQTMRRTGSSVALKLGRKRDAPPPVCRPPQPAGLARGCQPSRLR
jgi:hypothetical protein